MKLQPLVVAVEIIIFNVCVLNKIIMNFISFCYILGKEERTPSDLQSNTSERPMIEVKKQKTQK
jgi:hypothetical protein